VRDAVTGRDTVLRLHPLTYRDGDDGPDDVVVGRPALGEFVELPRVGADAVRLLGAGLAVGAVEERIAERHGVDLDVAELAEALVDLGFVSTVDGDPVSDPAESRPASHLPWLAARHVRWLFGRTATAVWLMVVAAAGVTWWHRPELLPDAADFYWTPYVGLAVLVSTAMFSVSASVHELMHLAAARSYGAPARIGFSTRLHYLVVQTDVTAIWAVPRRHRYRVYLAGLRWDSFAVCVAALLVAHAGLPAAADRLLAAFMVVVLVSMMLQTQVYLRTDLYYVLMEWLRGRNLYQDGLAYVRHLARRALRRPSADPTVNLPARERRGVRSYAVFMACGCVVALGSFALFGLPILVQGVVGAFGGLLHSGDVLRMVDSALVIAVEGALQVIFVVTFLRVHRHWFRRVPKP
jgi:putative peptide zinc metalloprotease protein